jgi:signal transduction histidine kinase
MTNVSSLDRALVDIVRLLGRSLDPREVAAAIVAATAYLPEVDAAALLREDADAAMLVLEAQQGLAAQDERYPHEHFAAGEALRSGVAVEYTAVAGALPVETPPSARNEPFGAVLAVPIAANGGPRWALSIYRYAAAPFPAETRELAELLADAAGGALRNALAYAREERQRREAQAISEAALAMTAELSLDRLLQVIVTAARELVGARYAALGVPGPDGKLEQFITAGISDEERARIGHLPEGHGLLGVLLRESKVLRLRNIADDPRAYGFPPHHPQMTSLLGVPILFHGRNVGDLYLTDKLDGTEFTEDDERVVLRLAAHAAVAIANARAYGAAAEQLQQKIAELAEKNRELQRLSSGVLAAQEEERQRIARELHDDTMQALAALVVQARLVERQRDLDQLRAGVAAIREGISATLADLRRLAYNLRPTALDDLGLAAALEGLGRDFSERYGVRVDVEVDLPAERLPGTYEVALYRIAQEALSNVARHARASRAVVRCYVDTGGVHLAVSDDGRGIPPERRAASREGGLGLLGMAERAEALGGTIAIESTEGQGTTVRVTLPPAAPTGRGGQSR